MGLMTELGIPCSGIEKQLHYQTTGDFLGIQLDIPSMTKGLPAQKRDIYITAFQNFIDESKCTLKVLRSRAGMWNWAGQVSEYARPWVASLYALLAKHSKQPSTFRVRVPLTVRQDAGHWLKYFTENPMVPIFRPAHPSSPAPFVIGIGDAAGGRVDGEGFGAYHPETGEFFCEPWPDEGGWRVDVDERWACDEDADPHDKLSSTAQEVVPLAVAIATWGSRYPRGSHLHYISDNKNLVNLFNKKRWSKRPTINRLLISVLGMCAKLGVNFTVGWHSREEVEGKLADILSRNRPVEFQVMAARSHRVPSGRRIDIAPSILTECFDCRQR